MSYFDDASLVMIPSGYKTSKVYSVKPTDGSGDLTFSRSNDTATRVNSAGLIEKVRTNLVRSSNNISIASTYWRANQSGTTTQNAAVAPDGTTTAALITPNGVGAYSGVATASTITLAAAPYTFSAYLKTNSGTASVTLLVLDNAGTFHQVNVTATTTWTRFSVSFSAAAGAAEAFITSSGALAWLAWGAQLETGDIATDLIPTTSAAVSVGPVANVPRLDYLNSSCPRLLLEPQRTNLALQSESVTTSTTNVGYTATSNATTSPDGYASADQILEDTSTLHLVQKEFSVGSTTDTYAVSFFVKANGRTNGRIVYGLNAAPYASVSSDFNLTAGTITAPDPASGATAGTSKIENYGNGWYRVSVSGIIGVAGTHYVRLQDTNGGAAGDPTKGFFVWGFQAELGSYSTSMVPTLGAAVTRGADTASKTGISSLIGQTEGTLFAEFDFVSGVTANYALLHQAAFSTYIFINQGVSGTIFGQIQPFGISFSVAKPNGRYKCAIAYKSGDSAFFVNGVQVGTTNTTTFTPVTMDILNFTADPHTNSNRQALLFKTRLTNAQLAELTTL